MPGNGVYNPLQPGKTGPLVGLTAMGVGIYAYSIDKLDYFIRIGSMGCPPLPPIGTVDNHPTAGYNGGNLFYNTLRGIDIYNYLYSSVEFNRFENTQTNAMSNFANPGQWLGQYGVQISCIPGSGTVGSLSPLPIYGICNNFFDRMATGIHIMRNYYNASVIRITCNEMGIPCQTNTANLYMNTGIFCEDVTGSNTSNIPNTGYEITSNTVRHAQRFCIYALNIKRGLNILHNGSANFFTPIGSFGELSVDPIPLGVFAKVNACIYVSQCENGKVVCNESMYSSTLGASMQNRVHGILVANSPSMTVFGNILAYPFPGNPCPNVGTALNWGVSFSGACNPAVFNNCKFKNTWSAYNLFGSSIGPQGTMSSPTNHDWRNSNFVAWQTSNYNNSDPGLSKLILNFVSFSNAVNNQGAVVPPCNTTSKYDKFTCNTLISSGGGSAYTGCPFPPWVIPTCPISGNLLPDTAVIVLDTARLRHILKDTGTAMLNGPERVWKNQRFLFDRIKFDNLYNTAPSDVQQFYMQNQNTGFGMLAGVDEALAVNDVSTATAKNSFMPANNLEQKQQQVNTTKIKLADTTHTMQITGNDISALFAIANGCPETDGGAFWEARTLLNLLHGQELVYSSNCISGNLYRVAEENEQKNSITDKDNAINVFPNPNNGSFVVNYIIEKDAVLEIYDIEGKKVYTANLPNSETYLEISNTELQNGVYMYKVIYNNVMLQNGRLVIIK